MINLFRGENYFLSNFYEKPLTYDGITYQNSEAAFQAQKTTDIDVRRQFADLDPSAAKKMGRKLSLRPDWEQVKVQVMYEVVSAKFSQNPDLKEMLIATGDQELIEGNDWGDRIWGQVDGNGQNLLGKILMRVRDELKGE
ncbi:MAG: NADAR family protein [Ruminococcus sp.]|nr:NADAR family protein [Ruminococcus sp.]